MRRWTLPALVAAALLAALAAGALVGAAELALSRRLAAERKDVTDAR